MLLLGVLIRTYRKTPFVVALEFVFYTFHSIGHFTSVDATVCSGQFSERVSGCSGCYRHCTCSSGDDFIIPEELLLESSFIRLHDIFDYFRLHIFFRDYL